MNFESAVRVMPESIDYLFQMEDLIITVRNATRAHTALQPDQADAPFVLMDPVRYSQEQSQKPRASAEKVSTKSTAMMPRVQSAPLELYVQVRTLQF